MENINIKNNLKEQIEKMTDRLPILRMNNDSKNYRNLLDLCKTTLSTYFGYISYKDNTGEINFGANDTLKDRAKLELEEITVKMSKALENNEYQIYRDWNICFNKLCDITRYFK